ncbi:hypothetical protein [Nostoc sp. DedQUE04]|uniref:hypothetical protein n=1 Tax=Nostoc sp. DedQUE04 TaxID=3075390 RepID=UPI002AD3B8D3|nr:hypothetical protein [Nostoc sp. DedQUE04]
MQLITVTNGVACRRTFLKKQATQSVSKSWHCIRILFKISILLEAIETDEATATAWINQQLEALDINLTTTT